MTIVIDARYVADHFPGIGRYVYNLIRALGTLDQSHRILVLHNPALTNSRFDLTKLTTSTVTPVATTARPFSFAEQRSIPHTLRQLQADLYHAPYYVRPYVGLPCPVVTTLYDAIPRLFPREVSLRARLLFNLLTRLSIRTSQRLITISQNACADLITAYRIDSAKISVTPLAAEPRFQPQSAAAVATVRGNYGLPAGYVLCVSSNKPHKNLPLLVEAWARVQSSMPNRVLVIAGQWDSRYPAARLLAEQLGLGDAVRFLPNVADVDLPALYSGCQFFVFPSRYEGFGLPPLEALACGAPVLCGAVSSLPEVVGEAALMVDIKSAESLTKGIDLLLADALLQARLRAAAVTQASRFSWRSTAKQTLNVYEAAVEQVGAL